MKVKLEGAGRSRSERMEARRAIPVPTDGLPPRLTTGGGAERPESKAAEVVGTTSAQPPEAVSTPPSRHPKSTEEHSGPPPIPAQPAVAVHEAAPEGASQTQPVAAPKPGKGVAARTPTRTADKSDTTKVKVTIFLTDDDAAILEAEAKKIGGVTPEMLMRKLIREFDAPMLTLDPGQEPELKPASKVVRKYRADLTFPVSSGVLGRYRTKYDKLGAYSDGLLVRHEAVPAFRKHILDTVRKLGR